MKHTKLLVALLLLLTMVTAAYAVAESTTSASTTTKTNPSVSNHATSGYNDGTKHNPSTPTTPNNQGGGGHASCLVYGMKLTDNGTPTPYCAVPFAPTTKACSLWMAGGSFCR